MAINIDRLMESIFTLGNIGFDEENGANRMAYSKFFFMGRDYVEELMKEAGLKVEIDKVGNLIGTLPAHSDENKMEKIIAMGSHIDTVPNGGIYDGALGVLAGIEVIRSLREEGYKNKHPLQVIAFNEEEGNVVGGTFGSKAFAGCKFEKSMVEPMNRQNITEEDFDSCRKNGVDYLAYFEYHIEQGGILEAKRKTIGIVEGIFGIQRYTTKITGKSNHAGSTPMFLRNDALETASRLIVDLMDTVRKTNDTMVCTVGTLQVKPGAVNVIPGEVEMVIELRDKSMIDIYRVVEQIKERWTDKGVEMERLIIQPETPCDNRLKEILKECADQLELDNIPIYSGAGHDVINTSMIIPSCLLFIPSRDGLSHHRNEFSSKEDIKAGGEVLLEAIKKVDGGKLNEN